MPARITPIPPPQRLATRLARRLRNLWSRQARLLDQCRNEGAPEQIHELRSVTRQLRVLLVLGAPYLGRKYTRQVVERARRLGRRTGRLRDLDVTLNLVTAEAMQTAVIRRQRHRLWLRIRRELTAPNDVPPRLDRLARSAVPLVRRYGRKLQRLRATLLAGLEGLCDRSLAEQHTFRRMVRRLRYLRELGLNRRQAKEDVVCRALIRAQTEIGRLLDDSVCQTNVAKLRRPSAILAPPTPGSIEPAMRRLAAVLARWHIPRHRA